MKILFVDETHEFGGAIISLSYMIRALMDDSNSNYVIHLITAQPKHEAKRLFPGVPVTQIKPLLTHNHKYKISKWLSNINNLFLKKIIFFTYAALDLFCGCFYSLLVFYNIKKVRPEVIHLNNHLDQWSSVLSARLAGLPCIIHQRAFASPSRLLRFSARYAERIITISDAIKEQLISIGIEGNKIITIYNTIDLPAESPCFGNINTLTKMGIDGRPTCAVFGRITTWKGQHVFIKALAIVKKEIPNICGIVVGSAPKGAGSYLKELKSLVQELSLNENIIFTGYISNVIQLYSEIDVITHTSVEPEPFGRTIIEAMNIGKPVIATAMGGPLEIIEDGVDGFLIEPDNALSLAEQIIILLKDETKRDSIGMNAQRKIKQKFSLERQANKLRNIYLYIIGKS